MDTLKKPESSLAIEGAIARQGQTKKDLYAEMRKELGKCASKRTIDTRFNDGLWDKNQPEARWFAKRLGIPIARILPYEQSRDDQIAEDAFIAFRAALVELDLEDVISVNRQARILTEWTTSCREAGIVDPDIIRRRLRAFY